MQATKTARRSKKIATAETVEVKMFGAAEASPAVDPQIAALLDVLGDSGSLPSIEAGAPPVVEAPEAVEVIESASVETLDVGDTVTIEQPDAPSDEALASAIAGLEVQEHYALVPADAAPHDPVTDEEAEKERLLAEENLVNETGDTAAPAAKKARAPRVHYRSAVMQATWGHLAPKPRRRYRGEIIFAHGDFGDHVVIRCNFKGLPDSPWFFEQMTEWTADRAFKRPRGSVLRFVGTYMMFKNGKGRFSGHVHRVRLC
jgi:hypothetical protein